MYESGIVTECTSLWKSYLHDTASLGQVFSGRVILLINTAEDHKVLKLQNNLILYSRNNI